jgi:hypothetical protein
MRRRRGCMLVSLEMLFFSGHAIFVVPVSVCFRAAENCDSDAAARFESFAIVGYVVGAYPFKSVHVEKFVSLDVE